MTTQTRNTWKEIDTNQLAEASPSTCRYCGQPIYWEILPGDKKLPVNAINLKPHDCRNRYREEDANTNTQ